MLNKGTSGFILILFDKETIKSQSHSPQWGKTKNVVQTLQLLQLLQLFLENKWDLVKNMSFYFFH